MPRCSAPLGESIFQGCTHTFFKMSNGAHTMPVCCAPLGESIPGVHPHFLKCPMEPIRRPSIVHPGRKYSRRAPSLLIMSNGAHTMPVYSAPLGESIPGVHPHFLKCPMEPIQCPSIVYPKEKVYSRGAPSLLERSNGAHVMPLYSAPLGEGIPGVHPHFLKCPMEPIRCPCIVHPWEKVFQGCPLTS